MTRRAGHAIQNIRVSALQTFGFLFSGENAFKKKNHGFHGWSLIKRRRGASTEFMQKSRASFNRNPFFVGFPLRNHFPVPPSQFQSDQCPC